MLLIVVTIKYSMKPEPEIEKKIQNWLFISTQTTKLHQNFMHVACGSGSVLL